MNTESHTVTVRWNTMHEDYLRSQGVELPVWTAEHTFTCEMSEGLTPQGVAELVFVQTNHYGGYIWDAMQPLPEARPHTALSVGDVVIVDGLALRCDDFGFSVLEEVK